MADDTRWQYPSHRFSECAVAQRTEVVHLPSAVAAAEIEALRTAGRRLRDENFATLRRVFDAGEYRTTWLQASALSDAVDATVRKLIGLMVRADSQAGWRLLADGDYRTRCVEYHENVSTGGGRVSTGAATAEHYDAGSLVTLDLMLSPASAFAGGAFGTLEADGTMRPQRFEQGDAICFVSHKYHTVAPVTQGTREVLVIEVWRGPERHCPHRCLKPSGVCDYVNSGDPADDELLPAVTMDAAEDVVEEENDKAEA